MSVDRECDPKYGQAPEVKADYIDLIEKHRREIQAILTRLRLARLLNQNKD